MKTIIKTFFTIFLFTSSFVFGQNLELYLGESLANVKKMMDQQKIEYREGLDNMKLPYLIYNEESGYVYMTISVHFDKKNGSDFISEKVLLSMPYNSYLDEEAFKSFVSILDQRGYEQLSNTEKLNYKSVFKSKKMMFIKMNITPICTFIILIKRMILRKMIIPILLVLFRI